MRQFDVYRNPVTHLRGVAPYLVVLSSHLLLDFDEAIVAPLVTDRAVPASTIELAIEVQGEALVLSTSDLFGLEKCELQERYGSIASYEDEIRRALDRLFTGF